MNRLITGFKVFFKKKGSLDAPKVVIINGVLTFSKNLSGLNKYTEYEFSVLAFTSAGDGPKTSIKVQRTKEDGKKVKYHLFSPCSNCSTWSLVIKSEIKDQRRTASRQPALTYKQIWTPMQGTTSITSETLRVLAK